MIIVVVALMLARSAAVAVPPPVGDDALRRLAERESLLPGRLWGVIVDDPKMRAEIRRVGFVPGCRAIAASRNEVTERYRSTLVPGTVAAIRTVVPEARLKNLWPLTWVTGALWIYKAKIDAELARTSAPILASAYRDMQVGFLERTRPLPPATSATENAVVPKRDVAAALSLGATYNLDDPAQLQMACVELLIDPRNRPSITTGPDGAPRK